MHVYGLMHRLLCADNATGARTREQTRILFHLDGYLDDGNYACMQHLSRRSTKT